jgi:hypothetical protein
MNDAQTRALIRRQQVRRAQIQHRQRRANYVRELEQGVVQTRRDIEAEVREVTGLQLANDALRTQLGTGIGMGVGMQQYVDPSGQTFEIPTDNALHQGVTLSYPAAGPGPTMDAQQLQPAVTMQWGYDETLQVPAFHISSAPTAGTYPATALDWEPPHAPNLGGADFDQHPALPQLTPVQTQEAINFILASVDTDPSQSHSQAHAHSQAPHPEYEYGEYEGGEQDY